MCKFEFWAEMLQFDGKYLNQMHSTIKAVFRKINVFARQVPMRRNFSDRRPLKNLLHRTNMRWYEPYYDSGEGHKKERTKIEVI